MTTPQDAASHGATDISEQLNRLPRASLAALPTPLQRLERLSEHCGREIWIKRDDLTGLALGGNKTRQFEFLLGEALARGCDTVIAGPYAAQSNFCRQLAAGCARLGLRSRMVLRSVRPSDALVQGNLLLDLLAGADVSVHEVTSEEQLEMIARITEEERSAGRVVYEPEHDAYLAAVAYVAAGVELFGQLDDLGISADAVYLAAAGETYAGLLVAAKAMNRTTQFIGVDPGVTWWNVRDRIKTTGAQAADRLGLDRIGDEDITTYDAYGAPGYGFPSEASTAALKLLARIEGLMLDPVYTSKAMAALLDDVANDSAPGDGPIVFLHTGGVPAIFHYRAALGLPEHLDGG